MDTSRALDVQFAIANDCLRSLVFASHIAAVKSKADAWRSITDICFSDGLLSWNMIFGTRSQETHWHNFNQAAPVPTTSGLLPFSKDAILKATGFNEHEWSDYHRGIVNFRNTRLAHLSHLDSLTIIPDVQPAYSAMCLYRDWLLYLAQAYNLAGQPINSTTDLASQVVANLKEQVGELLANDV